MRDVREGEEELAEFAKYINKRLRKDWDLVIAITGEEGVGKSTLANLILWYLDDNYSVERNNLFNPNVEEVKEHILHKLPRYSGVNLDEAIRVMYKLKWYDKLSIFLNQVYALCRKENKCTVLCIPNFQDLNPFFRQHRVRVWIHCLDRGKAVMFIKDNSPFVEDKWHLKESQKSINKTLRKYSILERTPDIMLKGLEKCTNFFSLLSYGPMPDQMAKEYKELASLVKYDLEVGQEETMARKWRKTAEQAVLHLHETGAQQRDIADIMNMSVSTVNRMIHKTQKELPNANNSV